MAIPETMWAAQLTQFNTPYTQTTLPTPTLRPNELLIKIHAAGFCHSDLQVAAGEMSSPLPMIPSHEPVGTVIQVGAAATHWSIGDRVGVLNFKNACADCPGCRGVRRREGKLDPRFCERRETGGFKCDGAFAEFMVADAGTTVALPGGVEWVQGAPLLCAGATVWGALNKARPFLHPADTIGIIGIGGLGQLATQFAKALGYKVIAIDNRDESLDLHALPAPLRPDLALNSTHEDTQSRIMEFTDDGLAAVINCTESIEVNAWSLGLLRVGGCAVLLGLPAEKWRFDSYEIVFKELVLRGNYVASREEVEEMMGVVERFGVRSEVTVLGRGEIPGLQGRFERREFRGRLVVDMLRE